jgi:hypothetical protein
VQKPTQIDTHPALFSFFCVSPPWTPALSFIPFAISSAKDQMGRVSVQSILKLPVMTFQQIDIGALF